VEEDFRMCAKQWWTSRWVAGLVFVLLAATVRAQGVPADKAREAERHYRAGVEAMKGESWEEAAGEFRAAIAADYGMVLAHYNLGQCRMAQKRYTEAVAAYRATKDAFATMGNLSDKDRGAAERDRQDEIRALRDNLSQLYRLKDGSADRRAMEIENRITLLENMQSRGGRRPPLPAEFPLALGSAYFRQEKLEEARAEYEEAVTLNPKLGPAHNNLAVIHLMTGQPAEAQAALERAKKSGFRVSPQLEADIKKALAAAKH
jgi:tetratricopeptide (TPR) repeat protein